MCKMVNLLCSSCSVTFAIMTTRLKDLAAGTWSLCAFDYLTQQYTQAIMDCFACEPKHAAQ